MQGPTLGQRLREARLLAGYQRARHFAEALGIKENTYCRYERDEATPSYDNLARICHLLKLDVGDIVASVNLTENATGVVDSAPSSALKNNRTVETGNGTVAGGLPQTEVAPNAANTPADRITSTAICSLHAWRLSQILAARTANLDPGTPAHLPLVTDYYFSLKKDPHPTIMPFLSTDNGDSCPPDAEMKMAIGRFLEAYHNHLRLALSKD